jgi:hypothetical protein
MGLTVFFVAVAVAELAAVTAPNAPKSTLVIGRFIAQHIIWVRMIPDAPTSEPAIIRALFLMTNPAIAAATPDRAFKKQMTTGMSAPPMGIVNRTPKTNAATVR